MNGSHSPNGRVPFSLPRKGNLEEEQVLGKVKHSVCASYGSLRHPSGDVKKTFGYMSLETKGGSWIYTFESCQY